MLSVVNIMIIITVNQLVAGVSGPKDLGKTTLNVGHTQFHGLWGSTDPKKISVNFTGASLYWTSLASWSWYLFVSWTLIQILNSVLQYIPHQWHNCKVNSLTSPKT